MDNTVKDVCKLFDIDTEKGVPEYKFSGLILDESGSE